MDFSSLDGYMFEELILLLFKEMGFLVEKTALSGDGGIDIIAYQQEPIFKGKYLIQCKNWRNRVGQPEVRDLYGVVMSENANKGMLITTSDFSNQAIEFAENKNIELIGYNELTYLLKKYNIHPMGDIQKKSESFIDMPSFNIDKYKYLKSRVDNNRSEKKYYTDLSDFYHQYVIAEEYDINIKGLIDEYLNLNSEIITRFCRRGKQNKREAALRQHVSAYLYLLKGELFRSIEICKDLGLLKKGCDINFIPIHYETHMGFYKGAEGRKEILLDENGVFLSKVNANASPSVIIKNLLLIFRKFDYKIGINYMERLLYTNYDMWKENMNYGYNSLTIDNLFKEVVGVFDEIKENEYKKFHHIVDYRLQKIGNDYLVRTYYYDDIHMHLEDLINRYYDGKIEKIENDLDRASILLDENDM